MAVTTTYGSWLKHTHELTVGHTIRAAVGEFAADYDLDALENGYRTAVNAALPDGVFLVGDEFHGPYQDEDADFDGYALDEDGRLDIKTIVAGVDLYAIVEANELWTIDRVVEELGFKGDSAKGTARKTLSRWGVDRHDMVDHPDSGRPQARYKSADVKAAQVAAPRPRTRP
ncbi:hypothetical protein E6R18_25315 [Streptomyces sp. A1277]|uniref:hypothetical protein n=1 Tax=Streptomyces sp. A1277 TaxID=2563103 RepID=UPI0010A28349|nr:hypothetical protein [Streptomyces sp. A1277]THA29228.1 hypothetical protein E6R18_25315 [Streptomyces sp. A1277]